jgi:hypothetical protein
VHWLVKVADQIPSPKLAVADCGMASPAGVCQEGHLSGRVSETVRWHWYVWQLRWVAMQIMQ